MNSGYPNYIFRLADPYKDNKLLLNLEDQISMPGMNGLQLCFQHKPDYFSAMSIGNTLTQLIVCEETISGEIVGTGSRFIREGYIDGKVMKFGYLANLRGIPRVRGGMLLAKGYSFLHGLHEDNKIPFYITTILEENTYAQKVLTGGRAGLPIYKEYGKLKTFLLPLNIEQTYTKNDRVIKSEPKDFEQVYNFLVKQNTKFNFSLHITKNDLKNPESRFTGFQTTNLFIYKESGEIRGIAGIWDQSSFKQITVINNETKKTGGVKILYLFLPVIYNDDPQVFTALLDRIVYEWNRKGFAFLAVSFDSRRDKLTGILQNRSANVLDSKFYVVHWPDENVKLPSVTRLFHLEPALL